MPVDYRHPNCRQLKPRPTGKLQHGRTDLSDPIRFRIDKPNDPDTEAPSPPERFKSVTNR